MGRSLHPAKYARLAQLVFRSDFTRQGPCPKTKTAHPTGRMVYQEAAHFFGRFEHCEGNTLLSSLFSNIAVL